MLTAKRVERTTKPGRYRDGLVKGLLLQISESGAKSWVLRYELHGREHMMGLGSAADFNLKEARERARDARQLLADGIDPLASKRAAKAAAKAADAKALSFRDAAQKYFDQHEAKWRNAAHRDQFLSTLAAYVFPHIGDMDAAAISLADVLRCIEPQWAEKAITMDRVRTRIEAVLDWCVVRGHRPPGTNPAKWKGHLDQVLPAARKVAPVKHFAALDYREMSTFMTALRRKESVAARALEFLVLTAARRGEILGARWDEIDLETATWTVPAARMKAKREHRVPLSPQAIKLLHALPREDGNPFIFIGAQAGGGLSHMATRLVMARMGYQRVTLHGFRSTFSDWAHETTAYASHVVELSLAHNVGNETERSYRRGDMVQKRVKLMNDWAKFCAMPPTNAKGKAGVVVPIRGRR